MDFKKVDVFADTGEIIERDMTREEIDEILAMRAQEQSQKEAFAQREVKKAELLAKLGITEDDAKLLLS